MVNSSCNKTILKKLQAIFNIVICFSQALKPKKRDSTPKKKKKKPKKRETPHSTNKLAYTKIILL